MKSDQNRSETANFRWAVGITCYVGFVAAKVAPALSHPRTLPITTYQSDVSPLSGGPPDMEAVGPIN